MQYVMLLYVKNNFGDVPLFFHVPFFPILWLQKKGTQRIQMILSR